MTTATGEGTSGRGTRLGTPPDPGILDDAERMGVDELRALQLERLRWTLRHAYENVPHYRRRSTRPACTPTTAGSSPTWPGSRPRARPTCGRTTRSACSPSRSEQVRRVHASSGTTGRPTVVGYTERDIDTWATVMARSIRAAGGRAGDVLHNAYGYGLFTGGLGAHYGAEALGCTVVPVSGGMTPRQVQLITDFGPRVIMVTPSYMLTVIDEFEKQGLDPRASSLEIGIFGAEPWTEQMRREMEERAGIHAVDIYGLSEVMGPGVAQECVETKDGLHVWEDHFYPEVIDPITGEVLPEGERGRAGLHLADQGGHAGHPVPHPRPHPAAARHRPAGHAPDGEDHRPHRRHDHPARGQPVPDADRGGRAAHARAVAALRPAS